MLGFNALPLFWCAPKSNIHLVGCSMWVPPQPVLHVKPVILWYLVTVYDLLFYSYPFQTMYYEVLYEILSTASTISNCLLLKSSVQSFFLTIIRTFNTPPDALLKQAVLYVKYTVCAELLHHGVMSKQTNSTDKIKTFY